LTAQKQGRLQSVCGSSCELWCTRSRIPRIFRSVSHWQTFECPHDGLTLSPTIPQRQSANKKAASAIALPPLRSTNLRDLLSSRMQGQIANPGTRSSVILAQTVWIFLVPTMGWCELQHCIATIHQGCGEHHLGAERRIKGKTPPWEKLSTEECHLPFLQCLLQPLLFLPSIFFLGT